MEERHVSLSEAADVLDISERTAYRWIKSGKLRAYKPGRDYRIPESAIKELVEESKVRPKAESRLSLELEPPLFNGFEDERHPTIYLEAVEVAANRLISLASEPGINKWRRFGLGDAAVALFDALYERVTAEAWETLPNEERQRLVDVSEKLVEVSRQSIDRAEDEHLAEEADQRRKQIREWTERISA